jgi:hypothetical protein
VFVTCPDLLTFFGRGVRMKIALLIVYRPGWSVTSPAANRRIVHARELADSPADASADEAEDTAPNDYSAADWGPVASALVRAKACSDAESDCSPDQNMAGIVMMHPRCLIVSPGISGLPRKRRSRPPLVELSQCFAIVSINRNDGPCVLTPRCCDCVLRRGAVRGLAIGCLCKCDRRRQNGASWR